MNDHMKRMRTRNRRIATLGLIVLLSAGLSLDNMLKDRQKIKKEIVFIAPNLKNKNIIADELAGDATVIETALSRHASRFSGLAQRLSNMGVCEK